MTHAISCRFLRLECSEEDHPLFRREYARNNRERGVKLLRCFPHCCPEHARRSYCGCSVHVLVTFSGDSWGIPPDEIMVCARFEPTRVAPLWPAGLEDLARTVGAAGGNKQEIKCKLDIGERVALPESLFGSAGRATNEGGEWILAEKENDAHQREFPQNSVLYVLNNRMSPKWFYSYDSSVTRAQREMTHHLVTYVFRILPDRDRVQEQQELQILQHQRPAQRHNVVVLARHASPGFLLVSYRRSGGAAGNPGCSLPAIETPIDNIDVVTSGILSASSVVHEHQQQFLQQQQWLQQQRLQQRLHRQQEGHEHHRQPQHQHDGLDESLQQIKDAFLQAPNSVPFAPEATHHTIESASGSDNQAHVAATNDAEPDACWQKDAEMRTPGFREKGQQLLIFWYFLQHVSLEDLGLNTNTVNAHMQSHWLRAAATLRTSSQSGTQLQSIVASFLSSIFEVTSDHTTDFEQTTIRVSGHLFLRAASSQAVWQLFRDRFRVTSDGANKRHLYERFSSLIVDFWNVLSDILRDITGGGKPKRLHQTSTLSSLLDDVLSIVYRQPRFGGLRIEVSALLLDRESSNSVAGALNHAFQKFIMQIEVNDILTVSPLQQHGWDKISLQGLLESAWNHRWLLEPGSVRVVDNSPGVNYVTSLVTLTEFFREFGCIDIDVAGGGACCMTLRSGFSLGVGMTPMELVLDGEFRIFRALPSGISSKIEIAGEWSIGDYSATLSQDNRSIEMDFYSTANRGGLCGDTMDAVLTVRRIRLYLILEEEPDSFGDLTATDPRNLFIIMQGTLCGSTYCRSMKGDQAITNISSSDRVALWNELVWTPMFKIKAGYVPL
ncbi:Hypothetical protein PHPALM_830 [Phytophthora palmivora]|uniref:Uncharacterized protein n=1 Tax=Phytophthora palmivora TaxID=4796 RepID=A0A2P4YTW1_9STRA|nr:Hypothetical protein PHPALM_830 [Phytophthora palmivora]